VTPDQSAATYFLLLGSITLAVLCALTALLEKAFTRWLAHMEIDE